MSDHTPRPTPPAPVALPTHENGIYIPRAEPGHLRADRRDRQTQRNYERLVAEPYHGAIVVDAQSGEILFEDRAGAYGYPASVTKLMTMLLTLEAIDRGEIQKTDRVVINNEVAGIGGSQLYLDPKEKNLLWKICSMASWCTRPTMRRARWVFMWPVARRPLLSV